MLFVVLHGAVFLAYLKLRALEAFEQLCSSGGIDRAEIGTDRSNGGQANGQQTERNLRIKTQDCPLAHGNVLCSRKIAAFFRRPTSMILDEHAGPSAVLASQRPVGSA